MTKTKLNNLLKIRNENALMTQQLVHVPKRTIWLSIAILALAIVTVGYVQRQAIYDQIYDWKLIPRPERLTELYFTDHTTLPKTYTPGETQKVKLTVHNLEYRDTEYTYEITMADENGENVVPLSSGSFKLAHDGTISQSPDVTLVDQGKRSKITVKLTYQGIKFGEDEPTTQTQSIHYWVEKKEI